MTRFLLDTNILVEILRGKDERALSFVAQTGIRNCLMSDISYFELLVGAECSQYRKENLDAVHFLAERIDILPSSPGFPLAASEKARLRKEGTPIPDFDILIACTAICNDCTLVTADTRHMSRIRNLMLHNWTEKVL